MPSAVTDDAEPWAILSGARCLRRQWSARSRERFAGVIAINAAAAVAAPGTYEWFCGGDKAAISRYQPVPAIGLCTSGPAARAYRAGDFSPYAPGGPAMPPGLAVEVWQTMRRPDGLRDGLLNYSISVALVLAAERCGARSVTVYGIDYTDTVDAAGHTHHARTPRRWRQEARDMREVADTCGLLVRVVPPTWTDEEAPW